MGTGGGRAATWGEDAFGERVLAVGGLEEDDDGTATGGVSPSSGVDGVDADAADVLGVEGGGRS